MMAVVCAEAAWLAGDPDGVVREVQPVYELTRRRRGPDERRARGLAVAGGRAAGAAGAYRRALCDRDIRRLAGRGRHVPRGSRPTTRGHPLGLTRREAEILGLLVDGLRSSSIAKRLYVSPKTVEHHVSAILAKLGVSSRAEAVALAHLQSRKSPA